MSATVTKVPNGEDVWGKHKVQLADIVGDNSYPTGGYTISPAKVGMKTIRGAQVIGGNAAAGKLIAAWDSVNGKLVLSYPTGGAAAPATVTAPVAAITQGAITVTNGAITAGAITVAAGATPVTSTGANGAGIASAANPTQATTTATIAAGSGALTAGIGKEVGSTTDVSSITVRLIFIGE